MRCPSTDYPPYSWVHFPNLKRHWDVSYCHWLLTVRLFVLHMCIYLPRFTFIERKWQYIIFEFNYPNYAISKYLEHLLLYFSFFLLYVPWDVNTSDLYIFQYQLFFPFWCLVLPHLHLRSNDHTSSHSSSKSSSLKMSTLL